MMCINTYSLIERICVEATSYSLSAQSLALVSLTRVLQSDIHPILSCLSVVYYESIKRELKIKPIYPCRCDGRLQTKIFTRLSYTGLVVELEHLNFG